MKCIVKQKYIENNDLKIRLLNSAGFKLEEASVDRYWGTGIPVYSHDFRKTKYPGKNVMGTIPEEIRDKFLPEGARKRRVSSRPSQTEDVSGAGGPSPLRKPGEKDMGNDNHGRMTGNETVPNEEQLAIMNKHLNEMSESISKACLSALKVHVQAQRCKN